MAPAGVAPPDAAATQAPALEAPVEPPMRLSMADERAAIAQEMRRLASAVASLERRIAENEPIDAAFASTTSEPEGGGMLGGAVLLSLLSAGVGWFLGSRYSRAQERGRQARIRF